MYLPTHFAQHDRAVLAALIDACPLATVVAVGDDGTPSADPVPLEYDAAAHCLRGHVARANPLWRAAAGRPALAVFHGPQGYVSPNAYETKRATQQVVPTWNYAVVHARGMLRAVEDAGWLEALVRRLTTRHEQGQPLPWSVDDAPADYVQRMLRAIVGIEIAVETLVGKFKLSQNRSAADRAGVAAALAQGDDEARALAALVIAHDPDHAAGSNDPATKEPPR